jgi:hypothetical protein
MPVWMLVVEATGRLSVRGQSPFKLSELIAEVQGIDSARARTSIQPVVQGMTVNAGKGPASPCGKVLVRMDRGHYKIRELNERAPAIDLAPPRSSNLARRSRSHDQMEVRNRLDGLITDFDQYVQAYDDSVPFTRSGQYEFHRRTIDRRLAVGSVEAAIQDEQFTELL